MSGHPFETLFHDGDPVEVDVEVVPLVELCWAHGLDPLGSCQDERGFVSVEFDGPHAERFLTLVAGEDDALGAHIVGKPPWEVDGLRFDEYVRAHGWEFRVRPEPGEDGGFFFGDEAGVPAGAVVGGGGGAGAGAERGGGVRVRLFELRDYVACRAGGTEVHDYPARGRCGVNKRHQRPAASLALGEIRVVSAVLLYEPLRSALLADEAAIHGSEPGRPPRSPHR